MTDKLLAAHAFHALGQFVRMGIEQARKGSIVMTGILDGRELEGGDIEGNGARPDFEQLLQLLHRAVEYQFSMRRSPLTLLCSGHNRTRQ